MSDYSDSIEDALVEREQSDFGGMLKYGAWNFPCSIGTQTNDATLGVAGFSLGAHRLATIRKSQLPDPDTDAGANFAFHSGQPAVVTDAAGNSVTLKIAPNGILDIVWAVELTLVHPAEKV